MPLVSVCLKHNECRTQNTLDTRYTAHTIFADSQTRAAYEKQGGICPHCGGHYEYDQMESDHITPCHEGGKTEAGNLQMLCKGCNRKKGGK